jgi:transcriptional regulator with XRE-family HTH domain
MGVVIHARRLKVEMARRGWSAVDLARESGISQATISAALAGRTIAPRSVGLLASALARVPAKPLIDALVFGGRDALGE